MEQDNLFAVRLHYESLAGELTLPHLWKRYIAALAAALYGENREAGAVFLQDPGWPGNDPLQLMGMQSDLPEYKKKAPAWHVLMTQVEVCLPLVENERAAFIKAEHGRLTAIMGAQIWDESQGEYQVFHALPAADRDHDGIGDPYELSLAELANLPKLEKRLERLNTYSYVKLFSMFPEDKERLSFLSRIWHKLTHASICASMELRTLFESHDEYLNSKLTAEVTIMNDGEP
jgi:hypothetical protein